MMRSAEIRERGGTGGSDDGHEAGRATRTMEILIAVGISGPGASGSDAAGGLTRTSQHIALKNQHRRRQITTHIIRSCRLPSHHEPFVRGPALCIAGPMQPRR